MTMENSQSSVWDKLDYFQNFKLFHDVYGILDTTFMVYIAFGMTPYTRVKINGKCIYSNMDWRKYLITCWYTILLLLGLIMTILEALEDTSDNLNVYVYLSAQAIFAILTINAFAIRSKTLLKAYRNCFDADKVLKEQDINLDYKVIHRITLFGAISILFCAFMNLVVYLVWRKSMWEFVRFCFVYSLPCVIIVIPVYHFFYLASVALIRLRAMNDYLTTDLSSLTKKQIEMCLWAFAKVHSELCNAVNNILYSSGVSLLTLYFFTYLQFSVLLLGIMNIVHLTLDFETYIWNMIYISTTGGILIVATILRHEATKTSYTLCELTASSFDDGIGIRRNTFLLQMLHQKIDLRLYGHFEIHLGRVLSDLQALINLLMFATQLRY